MYGHLCVRDKPIPCLVLNTSSHRGLVGNKGILHWDDEGILFPYSLRTRTPRVTKHIAPEHLKLAEEAIILPTCGGSGTDNQWLLKLQGILNPKP